MARIRVAAKFSVIALLFVAILFSSCKTTREITAVEAKPISTAKLLKKIEENSFDYDYFTVKRISCQFSNNNSKTNFRVNLKAVKDEAIQVSISKLNIPVGRVLLTPDSVKYVNYIDRNYFTDDYSFLSDVLNIDLDFKTIQSIISNNAFSYYNDENNNNFKNFDSTVETGMFVLQSENEQKMFRMQEKGKAGKIERRLKRLDDDAFVIQKMYFKPANFALTKLLIIDKTNERKMQLDFDDFVKIEKKDYPGAIDMNFISELNHVNLKIRMSGFSIEKVGSLSLNIPDKYEQIDVN